ncbi:unnamed protein product [Dovyalis caffra]|uniref:Thioredoxin-like protein AAED1, chloroplastic n=1 Tax=Dovyalis caffra TaxID=77055 RepID=A0AAV1RV45_9ROSI|nr:unnamed protein product [Dovyalis caffra]
MAMVSPKSLRLLQLQSSSPACFSSPKFPAQFHPVSTTSLFSPKRAPHTHITTRSTNKSSRLITGASASNYTPDTGEILSDVTIFTAAGEPVMFKDLWDQNEGMAVVALLRHFGCPCCWELASALKESKEKFDSAGVKLIAIGVGTPDKARMLADRLPFPMDCLYADPERKAYDVLGLYYGFGRTFFNPASAKVLTRFDALRQAVKNYTIEATPDDRSGVLQQGGMFVFKGKQLLFARKDEGTAMDKCHQCYFVNNYLAYYPRATPVSFYGPANQHEIYDYAKSLMNGSISYGPSKRFFSYAKIATYTNCGVKGGNNAFNDSEEW